MKSVISVSLEQDIVIQLRRMAEEKNISTSELIEMLVKPQLKLARPRAPREYQIIKCEKCGTEYSSRMPTCPVCEPETIRAWRENQELIKSQIFESGDIKNVLNTFAENEINQESINDLIERIFLQYNFEISESEIIQKINEIKKSKQEFSEQEKKRREEYENTMRQIFSDIEIKDMLMKIRDIRENMKRQHNEEETQNILQKYEDAINELIQKIKQKFDIDIKRRDIAVALRYLNDEEKPEVSI